MNCLEKLVNCKFLKNIGNEISQARSTLQYEDLLPGYDGMYPFLSKDRKAYYNYYLTLTGFKSNFSEEDVQSFDMIYYLQEQNIVWIASRAKFVIDEAIKESLNTTGDIYIYRGKHFIHNKLFHTVMYDLSYRFPPTTTN